MSIEALLLAFACAVRPSALAAVYALLFTRRPAQLLVAFIAAGASLSIGVGILVVAVLQGAEFAIGESTFTSLVYLVAGVAALGFAAGVASGWSPRQPRDDSGRQDSWALRKLKDPSLHVAAAAGVATHLPFGLLYLLGLNAIVSGNPSLAGGVAEVLVFNGIWYSVAVVSLGTYLLRPELARESLARVSSWVGRNQRAILFWVFAVAGAYFAVKGAANLVG